MRMVSWWRIHSFVAIVAIVDEAVGSCFLSFKPIRSNSLLFHSDQFP
jgi:hypothetical protein